MSAPPDPLPVILGSIVWRLDPVSPLFLIHHQSPSPGHLRQARTHIPLSIFTHRMTYADALCADGAAPHRQIGAQGLIACFPRPTEPAMRAGSSRETDTFNGSTVSDPFRPSFPDAACGASLGHVDARDKRAVGRWGEALVFHHLLRAHPDCRSVLKRACLAPRRPRAVVVTRRRVCPRLSCSGRRPRWHRRWRMLLP